MNAEPATFDEYLAAEVSRRRDTGLESARRGDPDGFDRCVSAIRRVAAMLPEFTSDDVHLDPYMVLPGPELGAAFRALSQAGEIVATGFVTSKRPEAHGRPIRTWTAA